MTGVSRSADVAQDFYGFRALFTGQDPYAILGPALASIGVDWPLDYPSAHPPTSFLLVAPVAWITWPGSFAAWAWLMVACVFLSFHSSRFTWKTSILLTASALLWPPTMIGLHQTTIVWLASAMLAFRFQDSKPILAGVFVGLASFAKFLPVLLLVPFLIRGKWKAPLGCALAWMVALAVIQLLSPHAIMRFMEVSPANWARHVLRDDNASPLSLAWTRSLSAVEVTLLVVLAAFLAFAAYRILRSARWAWPISFAEWGLFSYLSVVLLPILWSFSILPLLPFLVQALTRKPWIALPAAAAIILAIPFPANGPALRYWVLPVLVLSGLALSLQVITETAQDGRFGAHGAP